ncbi:MAG TPA: serine/threonine-protein kinase [Pirellulaceae bacterium]
MLTAWQVIGDMGLVDRFRGMFKPARLDVAKRFEFLRTAVNGTMSRFYQARDRWTDEIVGLKICDLEKTQFFEGRFTGLKKPLEGEIAQRFQHPHIVQTREYGLTTEGEHYLIMEYLNGIGLNAYIQQRSHLLNGKRLPLIRWMAEALATVHEAGFIHRDVCPRNFICLNDALDIKLIDFGLTVPATKYFLQPGNRTGTPNYMAPEILRRRLTDQRVDIFAFGVTVYQMCTLDLPWPGAEITGKAAVQHDTKPPIDIFEKLPNLDPTLGKIIMRCLEVEPANRPKSFADLLRDIRNVGSE